MLPYQNSRIDTIHTTRVGNGVLFDLLRDDLIHPVVCGNKWRKLKYVIDHALKNDIKDIVSFGGAYSNHLVALAHAGMTFEIKTHGFVRGEENTELNHYKKLCLSFGMNLIPVSRSRYKEKEQLFLEHFKGNEQTMMVAEGGDHPLAMKGIAEMFDTIGDQYDNIIVSIGTGTTLEGLVMEAGRRKIKTKIHGISSLKNNFSLDKRLEPHAGNWKIHHDYHRGKYGKNDLELNDFILQFYAETGIQTEFVYTGKMLMAFDDLVKKGTIKADSKNLCIHTGGLLSFPGNDKGQG